MAVVVASPRRAGRPSLPWEDVELVQLEELSVRHRAIRWLEANGKLSHPLSTSSDQGYRTFLGKCKEHEGCGKQWRFAACGDLQMKVSECGQHSATPDAKAACHCIFYRES